MINKKLSIYLFLGFALLMGACSDNGGGAEPEVELSSVYVINEGNFGDANGSVTSFNAQTQEVVQKAFEKVNGRPFAGIIQSATIVDGRMYLAANDVDKIEIVNSKTLKSIATISLTTDITALQITDDATAYAANLNNALLVDSVSIIDLASMEETQKRIAVGNQSYDIVKVDDYLYVANNGGLTLKTVDNTISVIDTQTNTVVNTIEVGDKPADLAVDASGRLWVVCSGLTAYDEDFNRLPEKDTPGSVYVIDTRQGTVIETIATGGRPSQIVLNEQAGIAYLVNDGIDVIDMGSFTVTDDAFINGDFSAVGFAGQQDILYVARSNGYVQSGEAFLYSLDGVAIDSFKVGIAPTGFEFPASN